MQSFFKKKDPSYFVGERGVGGEGGEKGGVVEEILWFIFISFLISKSFIYNFCGTKYDLSSKTT